MNSWGEVLVEWCNCLQLNSKIKDINELRQSDFFKNVLSILNKSDLLGKIDEPFFQILALLNDTYQYAQIDNINCDSFMELPEDQFLIITSLLLHYTCIYDGREKFTLPLCQHLSKKSQLSIKDFLEKINKDVKYSDLEKLIVKERIYEYVESKPMPHPLTAVFRTPSLKRKLNFDKDRTVTKLKTALELEQYEKADVEEELKLQMKKTQTLDKLLSKSNDEITALKSEIFKLKCQTPPQCSKKHDSDHEVRLLRKELENFEQYIENKEKEHEKLREERHMYKTKIEENEIEYENLRSKYLANEEQIYELSEKLKEKSTKVTYLETYCKELNEILEGFRQQKPESIESSFSEFVHQNKMNTSYVSQDNLASAVIEIQLKEAQEQIEHLNGRIALEEVINKDSIKKTEFLEKELNLMREKQSELENQLITEKTIYIQEIEQIKNERNDFCNEVRIYEKKNNEISNRILVLQETLDHLNSENCNQVEEIRKQDVKIQEMENIISTLKTESEKASSDLISKNIELEELMARYEKLQRKLEEYNRFEQSMKHNVKDLKTFHKKEFFEYTTFISKLKESIDLYVIKLTESEQQRGKLLIELDEKKASNLSMSIDKKNLKDEISKITSDWIEDKKQIESMLEKQYNLEKLWISEKEGYIQEIEQIKNERNDFSNEVRISEKKNNEISNRILVLQERLDNLNSEKCNQVEEIEQQGVKIHEMENIILTHKTELEKTSSDLTSKNIELEELRARYEKTERKLEEYGNFEQNMKHHVNELKAFHKIEYFEFTNLITKLKESIELYDIKLAQSENLRDQLLVEQSNLENLLISEKERYIQEIDQIKNERNYFSNEVRISEKKNNEISNRILVLQETLDHLSSEKSNQQKKMNEQGAEILELENIISNLKSKSEEYTNLISKLKESVDLYDIKLTQSEQLRDKLHIELDEKKASNLSMLIDMENLKEEICKITSDWIEDKKQKEHMLEKISQYEDQLISEKERYTGEIEQIKNERNDFCNKLKICEKKNNEISNKILVLQETLNNLNSEKTNQQEEMKKQYTKIMDMENTILKLKTESEKSCSDFISKNIVLEEIMTKHEILQRKLKEYGSFEQNMKQHVIELKAFHKKESFEYSDLISKLKESLYLYHTKLSQSEQLREKLLIELDEKKEEINKITSNWVEDKKQNESLHKKLTELEEQLISENRRYLQEIAQMKNERSEFCNELRISEKISNEISNRNIVLQQTLNQLTLERSNQQGKMEKQGAKILELENTISELESQLEVSTLGLVYKDIKREEVMTKHENSLRKLEKYISFEQYMKQCVIDLKAFHKKEIYECNELMLNLKKSLDIYVNKLAESEDLREKLLIELDGKNRSNSTLLLDLNNFKEEVNKITLDCSEDKKQSDKIKNENQLLKDNFNGLTETIKMFNDELNKIFKSLKDRKNKSDLMSDNMQMAYKEFNTSDLLKTPEKNRKVDDVSFEINILGEQISKLNAYIDIFSERETFYLKELENLKEDLTVSNNNNFDVVQNLKEQILDNEHQISSQTESLHSLVEKYNQLQQENQEHLNKIEKHEAEMDEVKKINSDEIALKELNIDNLQEKINGLEEEICNLNKIHKDETEELLKKQDILQTQISKDIEEIETKKTKITSLEAQIAIFKEEISQIKDKTGITEEEYETNLANLQVQVVRNKLEITELKNKNEQLTNAEQILSTQVSALENDKDEGIKSRKIAEDQIAEVIKSNAHLKNENSSLLRELETLKELREICTKYEQERTNIKFLEQKHVELSQKIDTLMKCSEMQKESYEIFKIYYRKSKDDVDKLLTQKNSLENLTNNLRTQIVSLNKYISCDNPNKIIEKKEALDVISEDIIKQYNRYSKQINDIVQELLRYYEKNCDNIFASLEMKIEDCLEKYSIHDLSDKLSDLTDRAVDILDQIRMLQREFENSCKEETIQQKENILTTSKRIIIDKLKEDDLKKKNVTLRQKITLLENSKSNLEKTVKKVREEIKKLKENDNKDVVLENDVHYKMLLQEYISYKEDQENVLKDYKIRLEDLQKEYEDHKDNCMRTSTPIFFSKPESDKDLEVELEKLQVAFANVRISNEKLENENILLKRVVGEHREEMGKFTSIKEAYDKLLEENNKLMTEVDTMKYKRTRDRDEFLRWLKKERYENESKNTKMIQNIKADYETKLEKMKDKMIKLYREEVNKEMSKIKQHESTSILKTVEQLECDLFEAKQKIQLLMERDAQKKNQDYNSLPRMHGSNSQLHELDTLSLKDFHLSCMNSTAIDFKPRASITKLMEFKHPNKVNPSSLDTRRQYDERQVRTLPRTGTVIEEVNIRRRTSFGVPDSIGNLQMEDEDEMFNNKYLTDLKQGSCELPPPEGRDVRVSELAWRNSLVPPHLKSSYPAETQFCSPERFREDDIKCGGNPFDDSSCKLLPNEKRKKDFGTTSYKKPGPPTPSKNGGRLSLTGNEMHVAKEQHSESKKSTPGRIRSLFSGRSSSRNSIEPGASPKKRLSIFRR